MSGNIRDNDARTEVLPGYVAGISAVHGKLARIANQQRDIIAAVRRMTAALRAIEVAGRRSHSHIWTSFSPIARMRRTDT